MEQKGFNFDDEQFDDLPPVVNASDPHMACLFLVDTSGSMGWVSGEEVSPIALLNDALNRFKQEVCEDPKTKDILDIAVIGFANSTTVIQEFSPIEYMKPVDLKANGGTVMIPAIRKAIDMLDERTKFYRRLGTEPYKPWIVMISDGEPFDADKIDDIANEIATLVENQKLNFWSLSVPGANNELLHKLSGKRVLNLKGYDFTGFFDWVNKSMRAVSVSSPGEKPKGEALPETVTIDDLM